MDLEIFAKVATFFCFGYWAISIILIILLQLFRPEPVYGKINLRSPRDLLLVSSILMWLTMWCFRFMV